MKDADRPVQYFTDEYLEHCQKMSPEQVLRFLDDYRKLQAARPCKSKLISMKVPEDLLFAFRNKAESCGVRYQTKIKELMRAWIDS